jgi:CDP-abequose synthase
MNSPKILITGLSGFLGGNLIEAVPTSWQIYGVSRSAGERPSIVKGRKIVWIGSMNITAELDRIGKLDYVIHLATQYFRDGGGLIDAEEVNVRFPLKILEHQSKSGGGLFINTDTFFTKPGFNYKFFLEYIASKRNFLEWCKVASQTVENLHVINMRLEHVYGPRDRADKFIPYVLKALLQNESSIDLTEGNQVRDFVYVDDVVDAYKLVLLERDRDEKFVELNVGSGSGITIRQFVELAKELTGSRTELRFGAVKERDGEISESIANCQQLKLHGWLPRVSLREGLMNIIKSSTDA